MNDLLNLIIESIKPNLRTQLLLVALPFLSLEEERRIKQ